MCWTIKVYPEFRQGLIQELEYTLIGYITTAKFFDLMDFWGLFIWIIFVYL